MIKYNNIKKSFNGKITLDIKELVFDSGKIYGLKGLNGSGKSTLCKILAKVEKSDEKILYPNINIGYMPQNPYIFDMSVINNIKISFNGEDDKNRSIDDINKYLKLFNLSEYKNRNAKKLSGGEKQKLSLIRLLIKKYDLLILDEPTSSMDISSMEIAENEIKKYAKDNNSVVFMVSHEEGELEKIADKIILLKDSNIEYVK